VPMEHEPVQQRVHSLEQEAEHAGRVRNEENEMLRERIQRLELAIFGDGKSPF
jgi:hypothetical protein